MLESSALDSLVAGLALVGVVVVIASLLSGFIERSGFPQVAVFLAIGAAIGPFGLGLLNVGLDSELLRTVATLSLALVLFTDAVKLDLREVRRHLRLTSLIVGPGVVLLAATLTLLAVALLGLSWPAALILGAALASTDPVLLRPLLNRRDVPANVRLGLRLETGLDDIILLPVVLIAMVFLANGGLGQTNIAQVIVNLFLLGPAAGVLVGVVAVGTLDIVRRRIGIRRDYESLYSLGVALAAFAAAEAVHGSGFVAAFVAGLTISALDVELCDCFVEYGETTAELALLLTFVVLGGSLIWLGLPLIFGTPLLFALIAVFIRPLIFEIALRPAGIDAKSRRTIGWFGPSGLSSLLLVLLPAFKGVPGSESLFAICSLAVVFSIVVHGGTLMLIRGEKSAASRRPVVGPPVAAIPVSTELANGSHPVELAESEQALVEDKLRITLAEVRALIHEGEPVIVLDVRTDRSYLNGDGQVPGALRMPPDHIVERARELDLDSRAWIAAYCT